MNFVELAQASSSIISWVTLGNTGDAWASGRERSTADHRGGACWIQCQGLAGLTVRISFPRDPSEDPCLMR